jgi:NADPH-dependent curcumin reductase CurA
VKNMSTMFHRRIRLRGFVVADTPEYNARFFSEIPPLMAEGKIKAQEQLFAGLESGPEAFLSWLSLWLGSIRSMEVSEFAYCMRS